MLKVKSQIMPGIERNISVPLSKLVRLDEAGIEGAAEAYNARPISNSNVISLMSENGNWPNIQTVRLRVYTEFIGMFSTNRDDGEYKYGIISGRHRFEAAQRLGLEKVFIDVGEYENEDAVIGAMLQANMAQGNRARRNEQMFFAEWLYKRRYSIENIAYMVKLPEKSLRAYFIREKPLKSEATVSDAQRLAKYIHKFFDKDRMTIYADDSKTFDRTEDDKLLAEEMYLYIKSQPEHMQRDMIGTIYCAWEVTNEFMDEYFDRFLEED